MNVVGGWLTSRAAASMLVNSSGVIERVTRTLMAQFYIQRKRHRSEGVHKAVPTMTRTVRRP